MSILDDWASDSGLDKEVLNDYLDTIIDNARTVETQIDSLRNKPDSLEAVATLFRVFHNLKGDALICRFDAGEQIAHLIESIILRVRSGEIKITEFLGEAILLAYDRLELAARALIDDKPPSQLKIDETIQGLTELTTAKLEKIDPLARGMIETISGFRLSEQTTDHDVIPLATVESVAGDRIDDLLFFRSLAWQLEQRSPLFNGRTSRNLQFAHAINEAAGKPIDPLQLEVAIYMHDVGMMFLPESVWLKAGALSTTEKSLLQRHPNYGAGLLARIPGWEEAARIVAQHHETPDGRGYPAGLKSKQICPGAKLMAIVDAYESVMLKQSHRGQGRSMLRAAAEINASERQFAEEWIEPFNRVARAMLEA